MCVLLDIRKYAKESFIFEILIRLDKACRNHVCRLYFEPLGPLGQNSKEMNIPHISIAEQLPEDKWANEINST